MIEKKEYIERGALSKFVRDVRKRLPKDSKDFFTRDEMLLNFQQYIECQKAADVEPVVQGEWMPPETDGFKTPYDKRWTCSNCKKSDDISYRFSKFCPSCGAHMERSGSGE